MEYCEGGSLNALIKETKSKNGYFDEQTQIKPWMKQITSAIDFLHNQHPRVIHRDLKAEAFIYKTNEKNLFLNR